MTEVSRAEFLRRKAQLDELEAQLRTATLTMRVQVRDAAEETVLEMERSIAMDMTSIAEDLSHGDQGRTGLNNELLAVIWDLRARMEG